MTDREIGMHTAQIEELQRGMSHVLTQLDEIKEILAEARGRWRMLLLLSGAFAAAGAGVAKCVDWFHVFQGKS